MTRQELRETIGENIRIERKARNLSTDELAKLMDVSTSLLNLIERGKRSLTMHNSTKLAQIFNMPLDRFVEKTENPKNSPFEITPDILRRKKLESLIVGLGDHELEFVISVIKEFKKVQALKSVLPENN
ncbi:MAG: helix-turn-helix domain-containing protein [Defluviitaleaceae bacterium]|nr:helix-turn-helix domain-containing protein [Defluviitaleaceae bacterium]